MKKLPERNHQKNFNRQIISMSNVESRDSENGRVYVLPNGILYPSITTTLSVLSDKDITRWQQRIGETKAREITNRAAVGGESLHSMIERYLKCESVSTSNIQFNAIKSNLDKIDNILLQEQALVSDFYRVAGRVDCIAEYNGELSVIDFKTSGKIKKKEWIESYFIQATFYAEAFSNVSGIPIDKLVIMMVTNNGEPLIFEESRKNWIDKLSETVDLYESSKKFV